MGWMGFLGAIALGAGAMTLTGCFSHDGWAKTHNREALVKQVDECNAGNSYACKALGDDLLGKSWQSRTSDWQQGYDRVGAKKAYRRACLLADASACAAIVEFKLSDSDEETARWQLRAVYNGGGVRSAEEVADAEAKARAEARTREAEIAATRRAEEASSQQSWAAFGQGLQNMQPQIQATANRAAGGKGTSSSSGGAGAGAGGGGAGTAKPDCSGCTLSPSVCSGQNATTPACYRAMADVNDCLASHTGCSTNPAAARSEAARLRKAAAELKR